MQRVVLPVLSALALLFVLAGPLAAACREGVVHLRGDWGQVRFAVEIADTEATRAQGLMNRPSLPRLAGMLFIYDAPQRASFWMENTLIPLDMLFLDEAGVVSHIHHQARPLDRTPIDGGDDVAMVLEINGGLARQLGIDTGSELRHPRIDPDIAAWPCPAE